MAKAIRRSHLSRCGLRPSDRLICRFAVAPLTVPPVVLVFVSGRLSEAGVLVPAVGDMYVARTAFDNQQTGETVDPHGPNNPFVPFEGDYGAHGQFDVRAWNHSLQLWLNRHRCFLALLAGGGAGILLVTLRRTAGSRRRREIMLETDAHSSYKFGAAQIRSNNLHAWRGPAMLIVDNHGQAGTTTYQASTSGRLVTFGS